MSPMDHAEAHERIADLALEPGRLSALSSSTAPQDRALLAHIPTCRDCTAEIDAWRNVHTTLTGALRGPSEIRGTDAGTRAKVEPIHVPATLRESLLGRVRDLGSAAPSGGAVRVVSRDVVAAAPAGSASRRPLARAWSWRPALLGIAAVLAVVIVGGSAYRAQEERLQAAQAEQQALATVTAALDRVLASDVHEIVPLRRLDGSASGSISWSRQDLVVLTAGLAPPAAGTEYRCWLENNGRRTPIGKMTFAGDLAFWAASLDDWATIDLGPNTTFGVSLETVAGPGGSPAVLEAALGS